MECGSNPIKKWIGTFAALSALAVSLCASGAFAQDGVKKLTIVSPKSADAAPDYENGIGINFPELYNLKQAESFPAPEDNGMTLLVRALGPRALDYGLYADSVPWEKFPTDRKTKKWFKETWTPTCEKLGLDPKAKPTALDDLSLTAWIMKYGITGKETPPEDPDDAGFYEYWEKNERKVGLVPRLAANACYIRLMGPWTAEEFPTAAKWIEARADLYDLYAQAARKPGFRAWRVCKDEPFAAAGFLLPDSQIVREIARQFQIRAYYRIGKGDFAGAIDDVETTTLFSRRLLEDVDRSSAERLLGSAVLGSAAAVCLNACETASPTVEDYERLGKLWRDYSNGVDLNTVALATAFYEYETFIRPTAQDIAVAIQDGKLRKMLRELPPFLEEDPSEYETLSAALAARPGKSSPFDSFDASLFMRVFSDLCENKIAEELTGRPAGDGADADPDSVEAKLAGEILDLFDPTDLLKGLTDVFVRAECYVNLEQIGLAMLAYQAEHGALPPAFTVDADGRPLHSWRVLVLPYLGGEAKALYEKIRLDEPWDSEYNGQFHGEMPKVFCCPQDGGHDAFQTPYSVVLGGNAPFDASGKGKSLQELRKRDGFNVNEQALIVERLEPICWMKPDAELTEKECMESADGEEDAAFGRRHAEGINYFTAGGGSRFLSLENEETRSRAIEGKVPAEDGEGEE